MTQSIGFTFRRIANTFIDVSVDVGGGSFNLGLHNHRELKELESILIAALEACQYELERIPEH